MAEARDTPGDPRPTPASPRAQTPPPDPAPLPTPPTTTAQSLVDLHHQIGREIEALRKRHEICEASHTARLREGGLAHLDAQGKVLYYMAVDALHFHSNALFTHELESLVRIFHLVQNRVYGDCYHMYMRKGGEARRFPRYDILNPEIHYSIEALTTLLQRVDDIMQQGHGARPTMPPTAALLSGQLDASHVLDRYMLQMDIQAHSVAQLEAQAFQNILALHCERFRYILQRLRDLGRLVANQPEPCELMLCAPENP